MSKETRDWILFTDETPEVPVYPEYNLEQVREAIKKGEKPNYKGTYASAKNFVLHSFATTQSLRTKNVWRSSCKFQNAQAAMAKVET